MHSENNKLVKNQTSRFAKILILLTPFIVAVAVAALYQESKSTSPSTAIPALTPHGDKVTELNQPFMQGEPFSPADGVNSISPAAVPIKKAMPDLASQAPSPTRAQAYSAAERQFRFERFDHSVVNLHATRHDSDSPGASIGAY